jgi:hypothetical protein
MMLYFFSVSRTSGFEQGCYRFIGMHDVFFYVM